MKRIFNPKRLVETSLIGVAAAAPELLVQTCEQEYIARLAATAERILQKGSRIVMMTGPSASGKTTTAHLLAAQLEARGKTARVVSVDNFFLGAKYYPLLPDGTKDYESPATVDMPLVNATLSALYATGEAELPVFDFAAESRAPYTEHLSIGDGICIVEGTHALNPELTRVLPPEAVFRIYASIREEYTCGGPRTITTRELRLCRRMLRDAAQRGRSPERTFALWPQVLDGENKYIKIYKDTADCVLDTSFSYELCVIAGLLPMAQSLLTEEGLHDPLWKKIAAAFAGVASLPAGCIPASSMLQEFYGTGEA